VVRRPNEPSPHAASDSTLSNPIDRFDKKEVSMFRVKRYAGISLFLICSLVSAYGQQAFSAAANAVVPPVIKYSGVLTDVNSKPLSGTVGVTFSLYQQSQGGSALWVETQNVNLDKTGHYTVMLGSTTAQGLPSSVFASGEARWLEVRAQGQAELPRTLLMSVPYALKALDAETVGGLPPSAFVKAPVPGSASSTNSNPSVAALSGSGTTNKITKWTGASTLGNSTIWDAPSGDIGIGTTSPSAKLDVNGTARIRTNATVNGSLTTGPVSATSTTSGGTGVFANAGSSSASNGVVAYGATGVAAYTTVAGSIALYGNAGTTSGSNGVVAYGGTGVAGYATVSGGTGLYGNAGTSTASNGVIGYGATGVAGNSTITGSYGTFGSGSTGVWGNSTGTGANVGVSGTAGSNGAGVTGSGGGWGVYGVSGASGVGGGFYNNSTGDALFAENQTGGSFAAFFLGNVDVDGTLSKAGGSFKIDHPLDPANQYLYHSFVESPDMKNIYDGVVTLDANGEATIKMPNWFGALNRDFRYQLTCIGGFAPVYIAQKLADNQFRIAGGHSGMEVSWQITGIRQDAWANAHRIPVEVPKAAEDRGLYLHPELFGAPAEKSIALAHHPRMLKENKQTMPASGNQHRQLPPEPQASVKP
jgi:trimeric autotransporter adhesin